MHKAAVRLLATLVASGGFAAQTHAQAGVQFVGTTQGCFAASIGACSFSNTATLGGLTYTSAPLALQTDASGFSAAGNVTNGFGLFALNSTPFNYSGNNFFLRVMFSPMGASNTAGGPANATSTNQPTYSAVLRGSVISGAANNGVTIDFGGAQSQNFVFTSTAPNALNGGTGVLRVFNKAVNEGDTQASIAGDLQIVASSPVPEPATVALMGTGLISLLGMGAIRRRSARV
jgi:hypothetical protein